MSAPRDRSIALSFHDTVTALMDACAIPSSGRTAFEARIRHLQRLGLPGRSPDKHAMRLDYGVAELAALATTFKLMDAFLNPALAVRYVTECWADIRGCVLAGAREALPAGYLRRRPLGNGTIALLNGNALADLGRRGRLDVRFGGPLGKLLIVDADASGLPSLLEGAGILIDTRSYMPTLVASTVRLAMATEADLVEELDRLRFGDSHS